MNRGIDIVHDFGRHAAVTTFDFHPGQPGDRIPEAFRTVAAYLGAAGIPATGAAISVYRMRPDGMTASVGFEVDEEIPGNGTVEPLTIPAGETLRTLHIGPYERLPETYAALRSFAARHGRQLDEHVMWEEYRSHPEVEPGLTETVVHWPCTPVPSRVAR
jgi:effector-binding domain-containing protein